MAIEPDTGVIYWVPTADQRARAFDALLRVRDPFGGLDLEPIHITVGGPNAAWLRASTTSRTFIPFLRATVSMSQSSHELRKCSLSNRSTDSGWRSFTSRMIISRRIS